MAFERSWESQGPIAFIANGGADGTITVSSVAGFKVKQNVTISSNTQPSIVLQIKRIPSPTKIIVGPAQSTGNLMARYDLSAYLVADLATVRAEEQKKAILPINDIIQAVYEQEPAVAIRTIGVDSIGRPWSDTNPMPIDGTITVSSDSPDTLTVQNHSIPLANTEYLINIPDNTKRYQIRVRRNLATGKLAFTAGALATTYWTITRGTIIDSHEMNLPINSKFYVSLDEPNMVLEVLIWKKVV